MIRVFISHKREDTQVALVIAGRLEARGLGVYLDTIDENLVKDGPDLAAYIQGQLGACTQLLAVITPKTTTSWWVPWEIGVATEKKRFLASFVAAGATVPEYLQKWPYLRSMADLDIYIQKSKEAQLLVEQYSASRGAAGARADGFSAFHRSLRAALKQ